MLRGGGGGDSGGKGEFRVETVVQCRRLDPVRACPLEQERQEEGQGDQLGDAEHRATAELLVGLDVW
jgi:hypothetical protein